MILGTRRRCPDPSPPAPRPRSLGSGATLVAYAYRAAVTTRCLAIEASENARTLGRREDSAGCA
jgi:hypothetical protein